MDDVGSPIDDGAGRPPDGRVGIGRLDPATREDVDPAAW
jgi:hypothetical protein